MYHSTNVIYMKTKRILTWLWAIICGTYALASETKNSERWTIWSSSPASRWEDAFVTGNGQHGTMVWGNPIDERITCVHEELFIRGWDRHLKAVPSTASLLPEVRRLINERKNNEADSLITTEAERQMQEMGASQRWPLIPHPAFDLHIRHLDTYSKTSDTYRRQLNMENGVTSVFGCDGNQGIEEVFSSRPQNLNVIHLKAGNGKKLHILLSLEETPGRKGVYLEHNLDSAFLFTESKAEPGWLTYRAAYLKDPGGYEGVARVIPKGGSMRRQAEGLKITEAEEVLILLRISPQENWKNSTLSAVKKELANMPASYSQLLVPHAKVHGEMFRRMQLDLGQADGWENTPIEQMLFDIHQKGITPLFMEQIHAMGRYLLISSCGKYPPPLQGIWGGGWKPAWIGGFVWDSNINLAISAAAMSNLPECAESYCKYVEHLLPGWHLNATNYLGCRGFLVAHYNDPTNGYLTHFGQSFPWMCWAGGAGWNIRPFYEYAMLMGDDIMLKKRVLPLYREMANFYEDFLVMEKDSLYHILPSISPENAAYGTNTWLSRDATMDVAIARDVFGILLELGKKFNLPEKDLKEWKHYLTHLPAYRINEDGALAEWIDPSYLDVYNHRHLSHLYPVFPGSQIRKDKGEPQLRDAAKKALDKRFEFDTSSAHGLIHVALQAARLGDLNKIKTNLDRFSRRHYVYNSLVTSHDPEHQVYNLDAVLSLPRLFMEMLVYTEPGKIELLPAWPKEYADGKVNGIRLYGGHILNMKWEKGQLTEAGIQAGKNEFLNIVYQGKTKKIYLKEKEVYHIKF